MVAAPATGVAKVPERLLVDCRSRFGGRGAAHQNPHPPIARTRTSTDDDVRGAALGAFAAEHPRLEFAPVVVVIAALDEEHGLATVLREVPSEALGLEIDVLVVDDGSTDRTSEVARAGGARVVRLARNCGHGVALRVGYQLAWEHGAQYIGTLDGDGQWDPAYLPTVLEPVVAGEADLVIGSRVLGVTEDGDRVRRAGVRVFSALIRLLTGSAITDTSSGLRAMRVEVAQTVRQVQVQYQTSELLIGALMQGYRVLERPIHHRRRMGGRTKKGHNVLYGLRYARVIFATWARERRRA